MHNPKVIITHVEGFTLVNICRVQTRYPGYEIITLRIKSDVVSYTYVQKESFTNSTTRNP
jgi:hypothetical protein